MATKKWIAKSTTRSSAEISRALNPRILAALERLRARDAEVDLCIEAVVGKQLKRQRLTITNANERTVAGFTSLLEQLADQVERAT